MEQYLGRVWEAKAVLAGAENERKEGIQGNWLVCGL